jgi:molybdopterin biosynthesis enzyme
LQASLTHFLRCSITPDDDGDLVARLTGSQSSAHLSSMAMANALLIVPADMMKIRAGERLAAIPLGDGLRTEKLHLSLYGTGDQ